jgi:hypothetical protein
MHVTKVVTSAMLQKETQQFFWPLLYENRGHNSSGRCCTVGDIVVLIYILCDRKSYSNFDRNCVTAGVTAFYDRCCVIVGVTADKRGTV